MSSYFCLNCLEEVQGPECKTCSTGDSVPTYPVVRVSLSLIRPVDDPDQAASRTEDEGEGGGKGGAG
jgi:hypothetical protein